MAHDSGSLVVVAYKLLPREPVHWAHAALGAAVATTGCEWARPQVLGGKRPIDGERDERSSRGP